MRIASHRSVPQPDAGSRLRPGLAVRCSAWSWATRVSTAKRDLDRQIDALTIAGIATERLYLDKKSGATTDQPRLRVLLDYARSGDVIVVHTLDRLGRTVRDTLHLHP